MTCFWVGILSSLSLETTDQYITTFIKYLKTNNNKTSNIIWNDQTLTTKELDENFQAISNLDENNIHNGYLCSTFEPVLFLVSDLFNTSIYHNYNGNKILYMNPEYKNIIKSYQSDQGHFWKN
jgi:hypothetical protein